MIETEFLQRCRSRDLDWVLGWLALEAGAASAVSVLLVWDFFPRCYLLPTPVSLRLHT